MPSLNSISTASSWKKTTLNFIAPFSSTVIWLIDFFSSCLSWPNTLTMDPEASHRNTTSLALPPVPMISLRGSMPSPPPGTPHGAVPPPPAPVPNVCPWPPVVLDPTPNALASPAAPLADTSLLAASAAKPWLSVSLVWFCIASRVGSAGGPGCLTPPGVLLLASDADCGMICCSLFGLTTFSTALYSTIPSTMIPTCRNRLVASGSTFCTHGWFMNPAAWRNCGSSPSAGAGISDASAAASVDGSTGPDRGRAGGGPPGAAAGRAAGARDGGTGALGDGWAGVSMGSTPGWVRRTGRDSAGRTARAGSGPTVVCGSIEING